MSNDRHLIKDDGTMGNLFRRVTLATLGLDSLEDVSDQSFEVIERADTFVTRLLGGVSNVMPKINSENIGTQTSAFADHLCSGMSGINGPKNATDLGDWQYWLDAALLMLFDEDEESEEENIRQAKGVNTKVQGTSVLAKASAVKNRVAALKKSGVTPTMLQALPQSAKKSLFQELKSDSAKSDSAKSEPGSKKTLANGSLELDYIAEKLSQTLKTAAKQNSLKSSPSIECIFAENSRNSFASHIADKATLVSSELSKANNPEISTLLDRWTESVKRLGNGNHGDMTAVRDMLTTLKSLEKAGAVSSKHADELRSSSSIYARHIFMDELSRDVSNIAERAESILVQKESKKSQPISYKAINLPNATAKTEQLEKYNRTFASIAEKIGEFSSAVKTRVLSDGDTAATVRWNRAADRFSRLNGISEDVDKVLLRDVAESAIALKNAGIVAADVVDSIVAASALINRVQSSTISTNVSEMIGSEKIGIKDVLTHFGISKVLGNFAEKIENSVNELVKEISNAGTAGNKLESFISDIRQILSTGNGSSSASERQTFSVIESICSRLDDFAEMAATNLVSEGYDELSMDGIGTFVSTSEENKTNEPALSSKVSAFETVAQIRKQAEKAIEENKTAVQAQLQILLKDVASSEEKTLISELVGSSNLESFIKAQKSLEPHLTKEARTELSQLIESAKRSESHLAEVSKQIKLIETSSNIARNLHKAIQNTHSADSSKLQPVQLGGVQLDRRYLSTLGETLNSFARIRDNYTFSKTSFFASNLSEDRLEQMLSTLKPVDKVTNITSISTEEMDELLRSEIVLGYDDVIPTGKEWVVQKALYPSNAVSGDITTLLGAQKAAAIHAADFANGRISSAQSLANAIERSIAQGNSQPEITSYSVSDAGEAIKISVKAQSGDSYSNSFELKHSMGQAYNPAAVEAINRSIQAKIDVYRQNSSLPVSGIESFIPVIAGASQNSTVTQSSEAPIKRGEFSSSSVLPNSEAAIKRGEFSSSFVTPDSEKAIKQDEFSSIKSANLKALSPISANINTLFTFSEAENGSEKFRMNVGGVDFEMTANDFVHMVAKPTMMSAAVKQPSLMDAHNILFSEYASMMSKGQEHRSIASLRKAYLDSLSQASRYSAHSEIGFSTESFTHLMGISEKPSMTQRKTTETSESLLNSQTARTREYENSSSFASEILESREKTVSPDFIDNASVSWVSNQLSSDMRSTASRMNETGSETSHQYMTRMENMLDYVETLSERNVGVFSTDETVRVLLDALPSEGQLGNKGLPKWRQRDTRATRAAEARELREALAKIGAQPVQGVQRFADRKYVSPNLLQNQDSGATPLFSSGTEGSTTPKATANSSNSGNGQFCSSSIKDEDLQFIAEEVFHKIEESLNEEHQRRRSE